MLVARMCMVRLVYYIIIYIVFYIILYILYCKLILSVSSHIIIVRI